MTLRARIAITAAAAVTLAFLIAAGGLYATTARTLQAEIDRSLTRIADDLTSGRPGRVLRSVGGVRPGELGGAGGFVQIVDSTGRVLGPTGNAPRLPVGALAQEVAAGARDAFFSTMDVGGRSVRVLTVPVVDGVAGQVARPLDEIDASLAALRARLAVGGLIAVALAAGLGLLVATGAVRPVRALTTVAEDVAATGDLTRRIDGPDVAGAHAGDELHRLATTFNRMLANLEQARTAQQRLVADASHELRTPLTSLRTNIEVLTMDAAATAAGDVDGDAALEPADRRRLLDDLTIQLDEFGRLVGAVVELARGAQPVRTTAPVRLDEVVEGAVDRARTFAGPDRMITVEAEEVIVLGDPDRLDRAVANLLDNALKHAGTPVEVVVATGRHDGDRDTPAMASVVVRDHGHGIDAADLPHIFERFYRASEARDRPGSGLGLAIVRQVAEAHGGRVDAAAADGGGTVMALRLPARAAPTARPPSAFGSTTRS